jgi:hypothetical protein
MMPQKGVKIVLGIFILIASLPLIQVVFSPFKLVGLNGAYEVTTPPNYSSNSFLNGKYQMHAEMFIKDNTPFKGDLVRFRNQVNYLLFNEINTNLTLGKDNFLFDPSYIKAIEGQDLHSDSLYHANVSDFENGLQALSQLKIPILVVFTPNKANYYKEYLASYPNTTTNTNANLYQKMFAKAGVPVIDADSWFLSLKSKSEHALIPKYGAHWSTYGAFLAADSVVNKLIALGLDLPKISLQKIETSNKARFTDDDYLPSLNLMWKWECPPMAYPIVGFEPKPLQNVLVVSDSYFWNFYDLGLMEHCFGPKSQLWYYNKSVYNYKRDKVTDRTNSLTVEDLKDYKAIIIMMAHPSINQFAFGFFNQLKPITKK